MKTPDDKPHKIMTPEEYAAFNVKGWHRVCKDVDGMGSVGVQYEPEIPPFAVGDRVSHPTMGEGTIHQIRDDGAVHVVYDDWSSGGIYDAFWFRTHPDWLKILRPR